MTEEDENVNIEEQKVDKEDQTNICFCLSPPYLSVCLLSDSFCTSPLSLPPSLSVAISLPLPDCNSRGKEKMEEVVEDLLACVVPPIVMNMA